MRIVALVGLSAVIFSTPSLAGAEYAEPPDGHAQVARRGYYDDPGYDRPYSPPPHDDFYYQPRSTVRIHTGPALRISQDSPAGGLFAAVDVGEKSAGVRLSGAWVRVGGESGLSQYAGELWVDFNHRGPLHPIIGAGAGAARFETPDSGGGTTTHTAGVGLLRGTLQYALPIGETDARASIDAIGAVPAIRDNDAPEAKPYLLVLATVGVGF